MRHLVHPSTLKSAAISAVLTAVMCYPRLLLWHHSPAPIPNLAIALFAGAFVLWSFVFAWHRKYTQRLVFNFDLDAKPFLMATIAGIVGAAFWFYILDPNLPASLRTGDPKNIGEWIATTVFALAFTQLVLIFAPFAWAVRLMQRPKWAAMFTVFFGEMILLLKISTVAKGTVPFSLELALLLVKGISTAITIFFYLRGGVLLVWWFVLLIELRLMAGLLLGDSLPPS